MVFFSQLGLLIAFCGSGYAVFGCTIGTWRERRFLLRSGEFAAFLSVAGLTTVTALLAWALVFKDFHFAYVAQYSNRNLPWYYSLSALWVGQSGSLLFWAWLLGIVALVYRFGPFAKSGSLKTISFAIILLYLFFLVVVLLFTADPTVASLGRSDDGAGLAPALQHPLMLIHPPIVFLGYSFWTIPFALALAGLILGRADSDWLARARSWAIVAWSLLGAGILVGGLWAYEEIGWGGYWSWDPVENGSLIPWLLGTAFLHAALAWRSRGILKITSVALVIATFACCNFAAFITRSGFFSSLHAFNRSPLGWMFLALMAAVVFGGSVLLMWRRSTLAPERPLSNLWSRESWIWIFLLVLILLTALTLSGTLLAPLSGIFLSRKLAVDAAFYNSALIPIGLLLLLATSLAPLLRWGSSPTLPQKKAISLSLVTAMFAIVLACLWGLRNPITLAVVGLAIFGVATFIGALIIDVRHRSSAAVWLRPWKAILGNRRQYAGFLTHLGFLSLSVGIAGSSLGTLRQEAIMHRGETYAWASWSIRLTGLKQRNLPEKTAIEAELEVSRDGRSPFVLHPVQNYYVSSNEWNAQAAIHSTWTEDFFVILHNGDADGKINLTFVENPFMRWIWFGGCLAGLSVVGGLPPSGHFLQKRPSVPKPHINSSSTIGRSPTSRAFHG